MKNRIYFFTGTGNSLRAAQIIAEEIKDCELMAITDKTKMELPKGYQRIGFVFPVYFQGLPKIVADFVRDAKSLKDPNTYFFAVATYGAMYGNALPQMDMLLKNKGIKLNYGANLRMFSNYVVMYNMSREVEKETKESEEKGKLLAKKIGEKKEHPIPRFHKLVHWYYGKQISRVPGSDRNFSVSDDCISCGRCEKVCPSGNLIMENGHPIFLHHCNQCTGCIQFCPVKAINYKKKTQERRRYTHPKISFQELARYYGQSADLSE